MTPPQLDALPLDEFLGLLAEVHAVRRMRCRDLAAAIRLALGGEKKT